MLVGDYSRLFFSFLVGLVGFVVLIISCYVWIDCCIFVLLDLILAGFGGVLGSLGAGCLFSYLFVYLSRLLVELCYGLLCCLF